MPLVAECTSWWGITASLPPWLQEKHTWRALACTYVLTAIHHCNPVPHGTYGTTLCLSYLASLLSCVKIEECQMSGFSTEKLHLSSSEKFVPCSLQPYALSWGTQLCLLVQLGCIDLSGEVSQRTRCSHLCWYLHWTNCSSLLLPQLPLSLYQGNLSPVPQGAVNHVFLLLCCIFVSS